MEAVANILFWFVSAVAIGGAVVVTFSRNIVYSAFALLGTFLGVAGIFVFASSDFVAVIQVLVYVGGVLLLIVFAVMLTSKIGALNLTNRSTPWKIAATMVGLFLAIICIIIIQSPWLTKGGGGYDSTAAVIGDALLNKYLLPFEMVSILLLAALIGAVAMVRREVK